MISTLSSPTLSVPDADPSSALAHDHGSLCGGCNNSVESEHGGIVVAFGNSLWHVDCFKCAKCGDRVTADTNLLLLSDGSPVCSSCSYNCSVCKKPILDEAIMTGDESYHAACFTCRSCNRRIEELVFARTSQGIYCMACHNERVARSRRHAEAKRNKSRSGSSRKDKEKSKEKEKAKDNAATPLSAPESTQPSPMPSATSPTFDAKVTTPPADADQAHSTPVKRVSAQSLSKIILDQSKSPPAPPGQVGPTVAPSSVPQKVKEQVSEPQSAPVPPTKPGAPRERVETLPLPSASDTNELKRRKSYDDGVRPLTAFFNDGPVSSAPSPPVGSGLAIPKTSRAEKRRSINPALNFAGIDLTLPPSQSLPSGDSGKPPSPLGSVFGGPTINSPFSFPNGSSGSLSSRSPSPAPLATQSAPQLAEGGINRSGTPTPPENLAQQMLRDAPPRKASLPDPERERERVRGLSPIRPQRSVDESASRPRGVSPARAQRSLDGGTRSIYMHPEMNGSSSRKASPSSLSSGLARKPTLEQDELSDAPPVPPKEKITREGTPTFTFTPSITNSLPIERETAPVAPALPPIEFSLHDSDFSDLLSSVGEGTPASTKSESLATVSDTSKNPSEVSTPATEMELLSPSSAPQTPTTATASRPVPIPIVVQDDADSTLGSEEMPISASSPTSKDRFDRTQSDSPPKRPSEESNHPSRPSTDETSRTSVESRVRPVSPVSFGTAIPRERLLSNASSTGRPMIIRQDTSDLVTRRLKEALADATDRGATNVKLDREFVEAILRAVQGNKDKYSDLKGRFDGMKRASQQFMDGLTVAQEEYDRELVARRDAEAEVTRLRVQLSGQAARLTAMSAEDRRRDMMEQMWKELQDNLSGVEKDLAERKAERDMILAEMEVLSASKKNQQPVANDSTTTAMGRSLTVRFDSIKSQYRQELEPLTQQREALVREINELKEARDIFLEETTALNARNEELAELNSQIARQIESSMAMADAVNAKQQPQQPQQPQLRSRPTISKKLKGVPNGQSTNPASNFSLASVATSNTLLEDEHARIIRIEKPESSEPAMTLKKGFKWFQAATAKDPGPAKDVGRDSPGPRLFATLGQSNEKPKTRQEHLFQQQSVLRFARCDHCGDKMWGTQLRCSNCGIACHARCVDRVQAACRGESRGADEAIVDIKPLPPSMFGRDLIEQVRADAREGREPIPVIVEKCIDAVEALAMDYEGIYRKTGGSSQSKAITQLFERGNYDAFDLRDTDSFNDISSITSVLKTYFRQLPNPLLTFALHQSFVNAAAIRDPAGKREALTTLVSQLPKEHYHTLRHLMLHLNRVQQRSDENLMNARNLGVVFGPTLMRSPDSSQEFADMAGKALSIEWLVENAPTVFAEPGL